MRKILILAALCSMAVAQTSRREVFAKINDEVNANAQAYATLGDACRTIGHRLTGSPNGAMAEQYVYEKLKSYGFEDVQYMPFEVQAWSRISCTTSVQIDHPSATAGRKQKTKGFGTQKTLASVALAHTPAQANVTQTLVDAGNGLAEDWDRISKQVKGRIALVNLDVVVPKGQTAPPNLHRSEKTQLAINHGAAGVMFINGRKGGTLLTGTCSVTGELVNIPVVCITLEDGAELRDALSKGKSVQATLSMTNNTGRISARNVIATLPGTDLKDEVIVVGGHLDSWDLSVGAIDNGVGSFSILDMARTYQVLKLQPRRTIRFCFFMGEEEGLLGSEHMVKLAKEDGSIGDIRLMMNLDMTMNAMGWNSMGRPEMDSLLNAIGRDMQVIDTVYKNTLSCGAGLHSDHQPFMLEGVPTLNANSNAEGHIYGCYHSSCDEFDLVNKQHLHNNVRFAGMMLYALACEDRIPARHLEFEEVRDFCIKYNLKDKLEIQQSWRWGN